MDAQPGTGASSVESPPTPDFSAYVREADARDLGRTTTPDTDTGAHDADSPSAQPGQQAPSTEGRPAASEPAVPGPEKKPHNLQTRRGQVDAEIEDLREKLKLRRALRDELATLDRPAAKTPPVSDPAPPATPALWQRYRLHPDAPQVEAFEQYEDFVAAMGVFIADQRAQERESRARLDRESHERMSAVEQDISTFNGRIKAAREADPDFDTKIHPGLTEIIPAFALRPDEPVHPANVLVQEIVRSEAASPLLVHFSTPEGREDWNRLVGTPTPAAMLRAFGRIEARFLTDGPAAADRPPAKPVTSAPAPPKTLGTKPPVSADRAAAAIKAGDFLAYKRAADAADLARSR